MAEISGAVRRYGDAYESAHEQIEAALEDAFTDHVVFRSAFLDEELVGRSAIAGHIRSIRSRLSAGGSIAFTSGMDRVGDVARWTWQITGSDGATVSEGLNVAAFEDDGRISRITVFLGTTPPAG